MDPYEAFAGRYDLSFGPFGEQDPETAEFFRRLFVQYNVHAVLDCACGTGRHLPLFHSLGCRVVGSDVSESMLAQARINLSEARLELQVFQADYRDLPGHFNWPFDAVVCLGAIGFMSGEAEFLKAFRSMCRVLGSGGILVLTAIPTDRQWNERPRFILTANRRDFSRLFVIDYLGDRARYNILDVFHSEVRRDLQVWSAELHPLLQDDQEKLLKAAGFCRVDFYGSFDFSPYDKAISNSLIAVASK